MSEICCECGKKAIFRVGTRLSWNVVIPPECDAILQKEWERESRFEKLTLKPHCEVHHKQFLGVHGDQTVSMIMDEELSKRLHLFPALRHPKVYFPQGYAYDDEEGGSVSD